MGSKQLCQRPLQRDSHQVGQWPDEWRAVAGSVVARKREWRWGEDEDEIVIRVTSNEESAKESRTPGLAEA